MFQGKRPYVISGPCGAESLEQLTQIAQHFKDSPVQMIRAGVWKPRTKPGSFEGLGEEALKYLQEVKRISGKAVCTEVANSDQVELALKYGIDCLWIGARSSVNPFTVQEIADAVQGTKIPIMIKNPINPDVELWTGAIQRIQKAGIEQIAAIHRGFSSFDSSSIYRNKPIWAIPIELKRRFEHIPIYCDISHICGKRSLLQSMAQRAMDLNFDGLMIESHPNPDEALSDAKQQITPDELISLLSQLQIREMVQDNDTLEQIDYMRQIMDSVDAEIVELLSRRNELGLQLGDLKSKNNMSIYQPKRWNEIVESRTDWGKKASLDKKFVFDIFQNIHEHSIKLQIEQMQAAENLKQKK